MELGKSRALAATLENDLEKVQSEAANAFPSNASVAGTYTSRYPHSSMRRGRASSPTSSIISGFEGPGDSPSRTATGEPIYGGGSGMLPMITAQRDRYKRKNTELEARVLKADQAISSLRSEVSSLQKDNLTLYEKTRYVSTYSRSHPATSGTAYGAGTGHTSISVDDSPSGGGLDSRYRPAYEAGLNPFAAFRSRESSRVFKRMSLPERAVFQITKMVLATRMSRNLFAVYCAALHLLVLGMLYYMESCSGGVKSVSSSASNVGGGAAGPKAGGSVEWHKEGFQEGG
jgi:homeobox protein cut-like